MRIALGLAANDVLFPVVGFAFLYLLGLAASFGNGLRLLGLSYLTGWALLGTALSIGLMLGLPLTILSVVAVAAALVAGCVLAGRHRHTPPLWIRRRSRARHSTAGSRGSERPCSASGCWRR